MKTEEKYPLLLVYLEDDRNSRRSERIAAGATAVITKWPNDITASCWLGLLLVGFTIFLFFLMALSLNIEQHHETLSQHIVFGTLNNKEHHNLRCLKTIDEEKSISDHIYITHTSNKWTIREHNALFILLDHYHDYNITLVILKNCFTNSTVNIENKLNYLLKEFSNLEIKYYNCWDYFNKTPLTQCWQNFSDPMVNFVTRVLNLWEYSGMSFNLKTILNINNTNIKAPKLIKLNTNINDRSRRYIINRDGVNKTREHKLIVFPNIQMLPMDAVTLDVNGNFMATRTICHSFFEHILQQLKSHCHHHLISVQKLIMDTIHVFCDKSKSGGGNASNSIKYCDIY